MLFTPDFETAVDTSPFGFCMINGNTFEIIHANPAFASMFSLPPELKGEYLDQIFPSALTSDIFMQASVSFEFEHCLQIENKNDRWIMVRGEKITQRGSIYYVLWLTDVTVSKTAEMRMKEAVEMKSNLLATMSHEIRTPMQAVYGVLELISEDAKKENRNNILDMATIGKNSASDLLEILDDVLDLAKLDADKMELDHFEVPIRTLCRGINEALSFKKQTRVALLDDIESDVPFVVKGDPKRLRQIITNLMGNAIKFTFEGSVTLKVTTKPVHLESDSLVLRFEINDTGIGMSQEVCDKLFQPFTQADNTTTRKFGGTGLGLSICKKLVTLMGGEIGVFSTEGKGSTFWFEIPTAEVSTDQNTVELPNLEGLAILVVEDHPKGVREIENSLRSMGADVESCGTFEEGLSLMKARPFDVAVVDHGLPDRLGLELLKLISDQQMNTGLIMYTVHDDYQLQNALRTIGATFLAKPASRAGLGEAVKNAAKKTGGVSLAGPRKLLIAEDTEAVRTILKGQLKLLKVDADFVENGALALDALESGEYGILFTDLHMPEMDGYEVIKAIRTRETDEDLNRFPVVVLTADVQMAQRQSYLSHGFDECLLKPVSLGQFKKLLIRWGLLDPEMTSDNETPEETEKEEEKAATENVPAVDQEAMENIMGGVNADTVEMLQMFADMTEPLILDIQKAYEDHNWHQFEELGHSLKGSARSACCPVMGDIASDIQEHAKANSVEENQELLEKLLDEFDRVKAEIKTLADKHCL